MLAEWTLAQQDRLIWVLVKILVGFVFGGVLILILIWYRCGVKEWLEGLRKGGENHGRGHKDGKGKNGLENGIKGQLKTIKL